MREGILAPTSSTALKKDREFARKSFAHASWISYSTYGEVGGARVVPVDFVGDGSAPSALTSTAMIVSGGREKGFPQQRVVFLWAGERAD